MIGFRIPRAGAVALAIGTAFGGLSATYPGGLSAAVRDAGEFRQNAAAMDECRAREATLGARGEVLTERLVAKLAVAEEVIGGRLTLTDATDRFLALNGDDPALADMLARQYDGSTVEEKTARNAIDFILATAATEAGRPPRDLVARLDGQFRATFGHLR